MKPKTEQEMVQQAIKELTAALEHGFYGTNPTPTTRLCEVLGRLGIKSAKQGPLTVGAALKIESLSSVLQQATFDDTKLKLWKP